MHVLSTPPAFILSQDQTLHLKVFHRGGSLRIRAARFEQNPALVEDRKNSGFSKKPGKRRLARSTQFSRNRNPWHLPRRTPYRRRHFCQTQSKDRTFSISVLRPSVKVFQPLKPKFSTARARRTLEKTWNPCGDAQYRAPISMCQEKSKICEKASRDGGFVRSDLHNFMCRFQVVFRFFSRIAAIASG